MGFAISLRSDHPSAENVRILWRTVERFEDSPSMTALGYPPHVTLAIYDGDAVQEIAIRAALDCSSQALRAPTLTFDAIRSFAGPPLVLWASPRPDPILLAVHAAIHAAIDPAHCRPYYRPGAWTPHCTLGTQVREDERNAALAFTNQPRDSFDVTFDALDCIAFPPLTPFALRRLPRA